MSAGLTPTQHAVLAAIQEGLPLCARPYADIAKRLGLDEDTVLETIAALRSENVLKRFGLVVRHRQLGFRANAMTVFDVPETRIDAAGDALARLPFVTLCYQRRRVDGWPFNLYCMIHGRSRDTVLAQIDAARTHAGIRDVTHRVLFSRRCFKQCGGRYVAAPTDATAGLGRALGRAAAPERGA